MFGWLKRLFFGAKKEEVKEDPVLRFVVSEAIRTGSVVCGNVSEDGQTVKIGYHDKIVEGRITPDGSLEIDDPEAQAWAEKSKKTLIKALKEDN